MKNDVDKFPLSAERSVGTIRLAVIGYLKMTANGTQVVIEAE